MINNFKIGGDPCIQKYFYRASSVDFKKIPGTPISYWVSERVFSLFGSRDGLVGNLVKSEGKNVTTDNARFIKFLWEVNFRDVGAFEKNWLPCAMGGDFRKWHGNIAHVIDWSPQGRSFYKTAPAGRLIREEFWALPGITWGKIGSGLASFRFLASEEMYQETAILQKTEIDARFLLSLLNSKVAQHFLRFLSPTVNFQLEDISSIPTINIEYLRSRSDANVARCNEIAKADWDIGEQSLAFHRVSLLSSVHRQSTFKTSYKSLRAEWREMTQEMQRLEEENNRIFIDAYGLKDELTPDVPLSEITLTCNPHYRYGGHRTEEELEALLLADTMREFISYAVGCMFGRYALDEPGLVLANQGETIEDYYRLVPNSRFDADADNVIPMLDGEWFADDVTERFRQFLRVTFGDDHYDENLAFIEQALNPKGKRNYTLRDYMLGEFYADHVKRYKKRPIYWLFSSPKGTFNALIYLHRYRPDSVSVVLRYLREFRAKLAARQSTLEQVLINPATSQGEKTKAVKEIDTLKKQIIELQDYENDTLYPLATANVVLDLDDGVKVNYLKLGVALKKITGLDSKEED
jgi:hypothetical protein